MATLPQPPPPPPPPPPMPGTSGAYSLPNWRDNYPPIRESAPSKEQIEKQQYAHLPDKLLNTLNKDKKPFTYTPSGVSSEKGVLDLSEIRSPRMKKRLLANLHAGEEEEDEDQQQKSPTPQPQQKPKSPNQYTASPLVLPPINDALQLRSPSPNNNNNNNNNRKEVRFVPSPSPIPMLACDDSEMLRKLAARKQDVEARATIVTNDPVGEDTVDNSCIRQQQQQPLNNHQNQFEDVDKLCKSAADAVRTVRGMCNDDLVDQNNNYQEFNTKNNDNGTEKAINQLNSDFNKLKFDQKPSEQSSNVTDVLKHVLDAGLQDEIDKFEEMGAKMGSTSPELFYNNPSQSSTLTRPVNRPPPPPVPPRPNPAVAAAIMHPQQQNDGRTSCPPFPNYQTMNQDQDFLNSFRCISPSIEILKKTQNTGYNYISKPRPFYRAIDEKNEDNSSFRPMNLSTNSYNQQNYPNNDNERIIPIRMDDRNGYSASLPRKIKLNQNDPTQPKSYDNPELGRQYLTQAGMFSQLPPGQIMNDNDQSPGTPTQNSNKMFYGVNSRQPVSSNQNYQQQRSNFQSDHAQSYIDPEAGRQFLPQAGMFSQLPPSQSSFNDNNYDNNQQQPQYLQNNFNFKSRQSSLPPPPVVNYQDNNRSWTPGPQSPGSSYTMGKQRLSLSELRKLPPSERPHEPPPMKYTGANIPSRSFRLLQLITGEDVPNQFVQEDDNNDANQSERIPPTLPRKSRPTQPPPPIPPRTDSYRPISQQQNYNNFSNNQNSMMERAASIPPSLQASIPSTSQPFSTVYASSSQGTDF